MKNALVAAVVAAIVSAVGAGAASRALDPRVPALKRQVAALTVRVVADETKTATVEQDIRDHITCDYALSNDGLTGLYGGYVLLGHLTVGSAISPKPPLYDDSGACKRVNVTRTAIPWPSG